MQKHKHHNHRFAEGVPDSKAHDQGLKMKGKTLEQFNVVQTDQNLKDKSEFAEGVPPFHVHGQSLKMKGKTLENFNVVQLDEQQK